MAANEDMSFLVLIVAEPKCGMMTASREKCVKFSKSGGFSTENYHDLQQLGSVSNG